MNIENKKLTKYKTFKANKLQQKPVKKSRFFLLLKNFIYNSKGFGKQQGLQKTQETKVFFGGEEC